MNQKLPFFDRPGMVKKVLRLLTGACVLLFLMDFVYHRHSVHPLESIWGFYAIYGFVACVVLVLIAKEMRKFLMRDEEYYDRDGD